MKNNLNNIGKIDDFNIAYGWTVVIDTKQLLEDK